MPAGGDSTEPPGSVMGISHWHVRVRMDTASEQPGPQPKDACQGLRVLLTSTLQGHDRHSAYAAWPTIMRRHRHQHPYRCWF